MHATFDDSIAFRWDAHEQRFQSVTRSSLNWSVFDAGSLYGAILVERFRTYGGHVQDLSLSFDRLSVGAEVLGIRVPMSFEGFSHQVTMLLRANKPLMDVEEDVGLVLLLSPGEAELGAKGFGNSPTCFMHVNPLPFAQLARWYENGTHLVSGSFCAVPSKCWPSMMKTRSRLPYMLNQRSTPFGQVDKLSILSTVDGRIADTSVANVLIVATDGSVSSPDPRDMLYGCTLKKVQELAQGIGIEIQYRSLLNRDMLDATEIVLTGSTGGVWHASHYDGNQVGNGQAGVVTKRLIALWRQYVGMDYMRQAAIQAAF